MKDMPLELMNHILRENVILMENMEATRKD